MTLRPRSSSLGARPLSAIPLSSSLLKLATEVWDKRATIKHSDGIYNLYSCLYPENFNTHARRQGLTWFFRRLLFLGIEMNMTPFMQKFKKVPLEYLVTARENYVNMRLPIVNSLVKMSIAEKARMNGLTQEDDLVKRMARSFFLFDSNVKCKIAHRLYLNVNTSNNAYLRSAIDIFCYIIREIMYKIHGVKFAKITAANRVESIIIYTSSIAVSNKVLAKIQEYQDNNGVSGFNPEIPMMTQAQMYGVATAAHPPRFTMIQGQLLPQLSSHSFGRFRAVLIYNALQNSTGCSEFFELIVKYFRIAGIDAKQPAIHFDYNYCVWESQINAVDKIIAAAKWEL